MRVIFVVLQVLKNSWRSELEDIFLGLSAHCPEDYQQVPRPGSIFASNDADQARFGHFKHLPASGVGSPTQSFKQSALTRIPLQRKLLRLLLLRSENCLGTSAISDRLSQV